MPDNKNLFDFGTGSIDKDQWLRDIDAKLDEFISMYGSAANKHRTTLLRLAFQDLRRRIASGDMLNRTADGLYQFGSALNREDKHMLEAYQRALGFMGKLARTQIKAPTPLEEKKYGTTTLQLNWLKYLNPSGKFNEKAYWAEGDDASRIAEIKKFLEQEKNGLGAYTGYEGYKDRADLESRIQAFLDSPTERNLQRLGFDNRNWITKPVEETPEEEPKSELEQALERYNAAVLEQQVALLNLQIQAMLTPLPVRNQLFLFIPSNYWTYDSYTRNLDLVVNALRETDAAGRNFLKAYSPLKRTPTGDGRTFTLLRTKVPTAWNGEAAEQARTYAQLQYNMKYHDELNNFFKGLGVNYLSYLNNSDKLKALQTNLAKLFTINPEGNSFISPETISKYFVQNQDGTYGLKGTNLSYDPQGILYQTQNIDNYKKGGVIKGEDGLVFDSSRYINNFKKTEETPKLENSEGMDTGDWVNILGPVTLDIGSMLAANVPGYGTLASGIAGLGSTIWSGINDASNGRFSATGTLASLGADVFGLVPGWGMSTKVGKIASKFLRYSKPIMYAFTARGLTDASKVFSKGLNQGFDSLDKNDWEQLVAGFTSLMGGAAKGTAAIKRSNLQEMRRASASKKTFDYIDSKDDIKSKTVGINDDISGELRVSRPKILADKEGVIKGRTQALDGFNAGYGIASNKRFGMLYEQSRQGDVPLHSWETWEWKVPRLINTDKAKQQLIKLRGSQKPKTETPKVETPKTESKPKTKSEKKTTPKKKKTEAEKKQIGGILYALRNGGIIKAQEGTEFPGLSTNYRTFSDWGNLNWGTGDNLNFNGYMTAGKNRRNGITWSKGLWMDTSNENYGNQNMQSAYDAQLNYYDQNNGDNIMGDVKKYYATWVQNNAGKDVNAFILDYNAKVDELRNLNKTKTTAQANSTGWTKFNELHHMLYPSYGILADGSNDWSDKLKDILGESTWRRVPNTFKSIGELQDKRSTTLVDGDPKWQVAMDNQGHLITENVVNPAGDIIESGKNSAPSGQSGVGDTEGERPTVVSKKLKNPFDPTPLIVAGKTIQGLLGNRNIYQNLLDEMPLAPLRDPIDRKLAIVGWQERIKHGQNELADLRRVQQRQQGVDQQTNFATALETERVGRDIMDKAFMEDSGRQFETAGKSWNIDNEDYLYNIKVGDDNRKAIADRARMMAQIRAAWRSGNNNILMGSLADTGNWLLKKYQREQDLVDKAKEIQLGSPEEKAQSDLYENDPKYATLMDKYQSGQTLTDEEKAYVKSAQAKALRNIRNSYARTYYDMYHTPWFEGGYKSILEIKNGTKLEIAKLKARGRDNNRYVSMIKDLRPSRRRR